MDDTRPVYQSFECAPGLRLEAHERVSKLQFDALGTRLDRLETLMERLERRLWLTVYGVAAVILAEVMQGFVASAP
ncbi:MAG: hypothetical protein MK160_00255 [Rhodobacteraceae bacterium]|nr:hypothetical protein [Paracoccaceae bacterium]